MACASPAHAATPAEVDSAIRKAKTYLLTQQKDDGSWETGQFENQFGGETAIATYALLAGGDSPQDAHIKKAVKWLTAAKLTGIYAIGMRAQVWPFLPMSKEIRALVARDAGLLLGSYDPMGRWGYTTARGGEHNSPTQYGVLGLWACAQAGFEVPTQFWKASERGWFECQSAIDGGWQYVSEPPAQGEATATMTAAGLASLFIAQDYLRAGDGIRCVGNVDNTRINAGLKWMSDHFDAASLDLYLLYGIERIGVASGYKYFGKHDWYAAGSETLVRSQLDTGSWNYIHGHVPGTAFAIFFLARGRAPIVMNKLDYELELPPDRKKATPADAARWNQRPRDAANVVRWISRNMERDLNWQVVNLKVRAGDLLDAPILYIAGDQLLRLSDDDKQNLKSYVDQGGIILGQSDCGKTPFINSFRELGRELFPAYDFRPLPPSHPVFNEQYKAAKWHNRIEVEGLSNGVRELMLFVPREDVARSWQTQATVTKPHHFELLSNIFLYAVDKSNLRYKGETYVLKPDPNVKTRRTVRLARIRYDGNWDPEPGGWPRLSTFLHNGFALDLKTETVRLPGGEIPTTLPSVKPLRAGKEPGDRTGAISSKKKGADPTSLKGFDVAHLTGTATLKLTPAARDEIRRFVEAGGTLLVDAAGGSAAFADAAESELGAIFGGEEKQLARPLPPDSPVYNLPASKIKDVAYRVFARDQLGKNLRTPRVRGVTIKNRVAVFFSREDLSAALVGQPVDGVLGYEPSSATSLAANLILYATGEGKLAVTQPSTAPSTLPGK